MKKFLRATTIASALGETIDGCIGEIVFNVEGAIQPMRLAKVEKYVRNCPQANGGIVRVVLDRSNKSKITITITPEVAL